MASAIAAWLLSWVKNEYLVIFLVSLVPTVESKGAIPIGALYDVNIWVVFALAVCSSLLLCPLILLVLKPIIAFLKKFKWFRSFAEAVEGVFSDKAAKADAESAANQSMGFKARVKKNLILFLFVALPAPLTGVWTGAGIAAFSKQKYRYSFITIALGCIVEGLIFTVATILGGQTAVDILSYVILGFMILSIVVIIIRLIVKNKKNNAEKIKKESKKENTSPENPAE